jgi:serine/threonine protein phosphatase PrpC
MDIQVIPENAGNPGTSADNVMWRDNPVPEVPEPHPAKQSDFAENGHFTLHAASVRGKKHKHEGTNRDDWYAFRLAERYAAVAVCDGAGSKQFSRIGAKAAAEAAVAAIAIDFDEVLTDECLSALSSNTEASNTEASNTEASNTEASNTEAGNNESELFLNAVSEIAKSLRKTVQTAFEAVSAAAVSRHEENPEVFSEDTSDYSTTFLFALMIPLEGTVLVAAVSVGDGNIAAFTKNGTRILGVAAHGDYSGETEFLQSDGICEEASLKLRTRIICENTEMVILATDGVADDYFPNETEFERLKSDIKPFLAEKSPEKLQDFLDSYYVRGSFDDRTLVAVILK